MGARVGFASSVNLRKQQNQYRSVIDHDKIKDEFGHRLLDQVGEDMTERTEDDTKMKEKLSPDDWKQKILGKKSALFLIILLTHIQVYSSSAIKFIIKILLGT